MQDEVGRGHSFFDEGDIADIALVDFDLVFDVRDIGCRSCGHVVEDRDLVAFFKQGITEVRTDKTGSTGDENAHEVKSIGAGVIRDAMVIRARGTWVGDELTLNAWRYPLWCA